MTDIGDKQRSRRKGREEGRSLGVIVTPNTILNRTIERMREGATKQPSLLGPHVHSTGSNQHNLSRYANCHLIGGTVTIVN